MAIFHLHASPIKKAKTSGAAGFARYLLEGEALKYGRYLTRAERARTDLVASDSAHLPLWAKDGEHFWAMASRYERGGAQRQGTVALCYQFTLPRELSAVGRRALADDLRAAFFDAYPSTWAIHNPHTAAGDDQPHLHVMFSTRREDTPTARGPATWFRQAAPAGQIRIGAGVKKDHAWFHRLEAVRRESAILINAALEREGLALAVSALSLTARGIDRETTPYDPVAENRVNLAAWQRLKVQRRLDIDREAILDVVRDGFWMHDPSPYRVRQREESLQRTLARVRLLENIRPAPETFEERRQRRVRVLAGHAQAETVRRGLESHVFEDDQRRYRYHH